jgi:hypothetical protein
MRGEADKPSIPLLSIATGKASLQPVSKKLMRPTSHSINPSAVGKKSQN